MSAAHQEDQVVAKEDSSVEMTDATSPSKQQTSPSKTPTDVAAQAMMHLAQGKRNLVVNDIKPAVESLEKACALFGEKFGETANECGEAYYFYGSALLELARLETGVIGVGEDTKEPSDKKGDAEEKESEPMTNGHGTSKADKETKDEAGSEETKKESKAEEKEEAKSDAKADGDKGAEEEEKNDEDMEADESAEGEDEEEVDADPEEEEEDVSNIQLAWEVLELAKNIFYRQSKDSVEMDNKLAETYLKLGEVSLESENYTQSIEDLSQCLFIRQYNLPTDDRKIAEVHYQLGNSYSFDKQFMKAKVQYDLSLKVLNEKISNLKEDITKKDGAVAEKQGEIEEIKKILPEITEKIADLEDLEKEVKVTAVNQELMKAMKSTAQAVNTLATEMRDSAKSKIQEFGEGSSSKDTGAATSTAKPATDISHLIKRKRESLNGEGEAPKEVAAKSPTVKKVKVDGEPALTNGATVTVNGKGDA